MSRSKIARRMARVLSAILRLLKPSLAKLAEALCFLEPPLLALLLVRG